MPARLGKPPTPSGRYENERSDSIMAKRPSCQKPWRGTVARKFGLPRPALSIRRFDTLPANLISSSLSSKGDRLASLDVSCLAIVHLLKVLSRNRVSFVGIDP